MMTLKEDKEREEGGWRGLLCYLGGKCITPKMFRQFAVLKHNEQTQKGTFSAKCHIDEGPKGKTGNTKGAQWPNQCGHPQSFQQKYPINIQIKRFPIAALHFTVSSNVTQCVSLGFTLILTESTTSKFTYSSANNIFHSFCICTSTLWETVEGHCTRRKTWLSVRFQLMEALSFNKSSRLFLTSVVRVSRVMCVVLLVGDQPHDGPVFRKHFRSDEDPEHCEDLKKKVLEHTHTQETCCNWKLKSVGH